MRCGPSRIILQLINRVTWGGLRIPNGQRLYIGQSDLQGAFCHLALDPELAKMFSLPHVRGVCLREWGVAEEHGGDLFYSEQVWPYLRVAPICFSLSFWIAQRLRTFQAAQGGRLDAEHVLTDHSPISDLSDGLPVMVSYCDNLNIAGAEKEAVDTSLCGTKVCWSVKWRKETHTVNL